LVDAGGAEEGFRLLDAERAGLVQIERDADILADVSKSASSRQPPSPHTPPSTTRCAAPATPPTPAS
jgi:hypothetical protein